MESMIAGNRIIASGNTTGTTPGYGGADWTTPTDGTATVTVTEALLKSGIQAAWDDGGDPSVIMIPYAQKGQIATFTGAAKYAGAYTNNGRAQAALIGAVDVYISDAGDHKLMLNRYVRTRTILGIDPEYWSVAFLRGIRSVPLAKTGDATKSMLLAEFCLVGDNPDSSFKLQDMA